MKAFRLLLIILITSFLIIAIFADEFTPLTYQYQNPDITISFNEPLQVSADRQQEIANAIAGVGQEDLSTPVVDHQANIICTLFGHDIAPQSTVTATHHKVRQYNPRCLMEVYHVLYCKRCDYAVSELVNDFYIVCCPED